MQMYVVFVNDKPIFLTSSQIKENKYPVYLLKDIVTEEIIHKLKDKKLKGINLYTPDLEPVSYTHLTLPTISSV